MSKKVIDFHGWTTEEAIPKLEHIINDLKNGKIAEIEIITGKGTGTIKNITIDILDKNSISYVLKNDGGSLIAYIKENRQTFFQKMFKRSSQEVPTQKEINFLFEEYKNKL
ncbi:Smr/MutS family protein [Mycoplasmopsis cricetuli]|uniref:Smr/MutS family protein n=1 Tax=Mycoplasmopsis cricetuli TaxID=171283 RepID=UPI000471DEAD|nr:Smr/MutS family protein [Mycoplasmopsis cricetuli]